MSYYQEAYYLKGLFWKKGGAGEKKGEAGEGDGSRKAAIRLEGIWAEIHMRE